MSSPSSELKSYATKILVAVSLVLVLYGIFYIADLLSSNLNLFEYAYTIWLLFRMVLATVIIYIGVMIYKISRVVSKMSASFFEAIIAKKEKSSFLIPLSIILTISIPVLLSFYASLPLEYPYPPFYGQLIYNERLAGYFGYANDYTYMGVRITPNINLQTLSSRAQYHGYSIIHGYDVTTTYYTLNRTAKYQKTPKVTIKHEKILDENVSVTFIVTAYSEGFVKINVESRYFLNKNWIRRIFAKMFFDVGLPTVGIRRFTITEDWIIVWKAP